MQRYNVFSYVKSDVVHEQHEMNAHKTEVRQ